MDDTHQAIAYEPPLPLPPPHHRLTVSYPTLQLITYPGENLPDTGFGTPNPGLTVSDGIHTVER